MPSPTSSCLPTLTKACTRCHSHKIKCDAKVVGLPCSRCIQKGHSDSCFRATRHSRRRVDTKPKQPHVINPMPQYFPTLDYVAPAGTACLTSHCQAPDVSIAPPSEYGKKQVVQENEARIRVCQELATGDRISSSELIVDSAPGRDVVEYHNGANYLSILGQTLRRDNRKRITRMVVDNDVSDSRVVYPSQVLDEVLVQHSGLDGLDATDRDYLLKKGTFTFPSKECVQVYLKYYFEMVHPYSPVFDRVEFMQCYESGKCSAFLLQAILASAALYIPAQTLEASGYADITEAQTSFFTKASLLYDFRCERSQLRLLQGSIILSSTLLSYSLDKDFRYWFLNAVRLAVKMGLHESDLVHDMDLETYRLCKRIWWVLYTRDVFFSYTGYQNMRMLTDTDCDTIPLIEDVWRNELIPLEHERVLAPVSIAQKLYFIEDSKLAVIGSRCMSAMRHNRDQCLDDIRSQFESWHFSLAETMRISHDETTGDEVWHSILLATSYRYECILYRMLRIWWQNRDLNQHTRVKQRLRTSMIELDTIIRRVLTGDSFKKYPLFFHSCIPTVLALYIEAARDNSDTDVNRSIAQLQISQIMLLLRQLKNFPIMQRAITVFEWVLSQAEPPTQPQCVDGQPETSSVLSSAQTVEAEGDESSMYNGPKNTIAPAMPIPDISSGSVYGLEDFLGFDFWGNMGQSVAEGSMG